MNLWGGMCPLCPKMICVPLSMVSTLNFGVLLNGIDGARRALILHSGGSVQVSGGAIVMMVFCSFCLISVFWNLVLGMPCMFLVCLLRTSLLLSVWLNIEHWYFVAVGLWMFFICLAKLWLFLSRLWHISYLIPISSIITVLGSILQVRVFAIALSKPPLFSLTVWLFDMKWRDTGLKSFPALMSVRCPSKRSLIVLLVYPTYVGRFLNS